MFFDGTDDQGGDDDTGGAAPDITKPDPNLSRREQRRLRLEQMKRSRTSSISSVGSSTIPTLDEESNPTGNPGTPKEDPTAS